MIKDEQNRSSRGLGNDISVVCTLSDKEVFTENFILETLAWHPTYLG